MPPTRSLRSGPTLEAVRDAVRAEFGPAARIVSAERVTSPGIGGLFRRAHVEAVVEVPDRTAPPTATVAIADGPVTRVGIAALLADADAAEARIAARDGTASTRADAFASVLDGFAADGIAPRTAAVTAPAPVDVPALPDAAALPGPAGTTGPDGSAPGLPSVAAALPAPVPPTVRTSDGDLVLLVGRPTDVDAAAGVFAARHGLRPTDARDRRSGILVRAEGVGAGHALLGVAAWDDAATMTGLAPDQVWVVVDVGRKPEDAAAMLGAVAARVPVAGVVAIGAGETATPDTVRLLGVPVLSLG